MLSKVQKETIRKRKRDETRRETLLLKMAELIPLRLLSKYQLTKKVGGAIAIHKKDKVEQEPLYSCPNCAEVVIHWGDCFCPRCGRKLKWYNPRVRARRRKI